MLIFGAGCKTPFPVVEHCVLDSITEKAYCVKGDKEYELDYYDVDSYIARSKEDERKIIEWIQRECRSK